MSSSNNFQKSCDVEMSTVVGAISSDPSAAGAVPAHIAEFLSFQTELAHCEAEETANPIRGMSLRPATPTNAPTSEVPLVRDAIAAGGMVATDVSAPEVKVQQSGSSTTPVHVIDAKPVHESMPPLPPAKRDTVL
ncbi:hypothetical protein Bca52824_035213 [Brassica carinata]|uniref:Uncharacterized protein n=1 Tax=Brassica carinata TaxID=52824 RepID=A0A8X7V2H9_BRACI|nr:hypothetical protein Bca52824_035213 [Brassica carinata]